jgi:hypothetical protein
MVKRSPTFNRTQQTGQQVRFSENRHGLTKKIIDENALGLTALRGNPRS